MDGGTAGVSPAPFLLKTYEMVDDATTDDVVSWSENRKSFVVWNPPELARVLLPSYFKHSNFSSFIRQLNTYGFRKIDPERWEFANEDFVKDQKHLLKNIYRRKPIHSHSQPQISVDSERAAFVEEIYKLSREKADLEGNVLTYKEQQSTAKVQLENLTQRVSTMEHRQEKLLSFLEKAVQNPEFVEHLSQKLELMGVSAYNKKRRIPPADHAQSILESALVDNNNSSRLESIGMSHQDFSNQLRLELPSAVSDVNMLSCSTQSSNEDGVSLEWRREAWSKHMHEETASFLSSPDVLELSDTGASSNLNVDSPSSCRVGPKSPQLHSLQTTTSNDEGNIHLSCLLNLTLASSSLELSGSQNSAGMPRSISELSAVSRLNSGTGKGGHKALSQDRAFDDAQILSSSHDVRNSNQVPTPPATDRINDVFWEQFLTERPGCSDNEEATSAHRANPYLQKENISVIEIAKGPNSMELLTL